MALAAAFVAGAIGGALADWPSLVIGAAVAAVVYRFVIASGEEPGGPGDAAGAVAERKPGTLTGDVAEVETAVAEVEDEKRRKRK